MEAAIDTVPLQGSGGGEATGHVWRWFTGASKRSSNRPEPVFLDMNAVASSETGTPAVEESWDIRGLLPNDTPHDVDVEEHKTSFTQPPSLLLVHDEDEAGDIVNENQVEKKVSSRKALTHPASTGVSAVSTTTAEPQLEERQQQTASQETAERKTTSSESVPVAKDPPQKKPSGSATSKALPEAEVLRASLPAALLRSTSGGSQQTADVKDEEVDDDLEALLSMDIAKARPASRSKASSSIATNSTNVTTAPSPAVVESTGDADLDDLLDL